MSFDQQIFITLLDKGLLAFVLLFGGFVLNWYLQNRKARDETIRELATSRADAYKDLWRILEEVKPAEFNAGEEDTKKKLDEALTNWYFNECGALFMSWQTTRQFFLVLDTVRNPTATFRQTQKMVSLLRTRLKQDCGIYSFFEALRQLPTPRKSPYLANKSMNQDAL